MATEAQLLEAPANNALVSSFERVEPRGEEFSGGGSRGSKSDKKLLLNQPQKAAVILAALGPEQAATVIRDLSPDEVRMFARASSKLKDIPKDTIDETIMEFIETLDKEGLAMTPDKLKRILAGVMTDDQIERIFEDIDEAEGRSVWDKLSNADIVDLGKFLAREHPQTVAVVISKIRPERAAKVMVRFEKEFADEVVMRLSKISQLSTSVIDAVKETLEVDFLRNARQAKSKRKPDEMIGSIMNFLPNERRDDLMKTISEHSEPLAQAVQRKMFTFADIPHRVERADVATVVREVDNAILITALVSAQETEPAAVTYFFENISRRLSEQMQETMEESAKPDKKEGEDAQFAIIDTIRKLSDRGVIKLNMGGDDDEDSY